MQYRARSIANHYALAALFPALSVFAAAAESPMPTEDSAIATKLNQCIAGLTALEGLAAVSEWQYDKDRMANAKRVARRGAISLVGEQRARELYEASREGTKAALAHAIDHGSTGIQAFVRSTVDLCTSTVESNREYLAAKIAEEQRRREAAKLQPDGSK
jgi:hypothetical protein